MTVARPTLAVCVLARSTRGGLARLLDEVDGLADEIVIGVDEQSADETWAIAAARADVVFRFEHVGPPVRARLLPIAHARADWVLSLDEDEGLDEALASLLPELVRDPRYTHYWLPRKWIVNRQPLTYLHDVPWFPDWQLRLFRRDPRRVWHPGILHSGYRVMGPGCREDRVAILHYEPVILTPEERDAKVEYYRQHGSQGRSDAAYRSMDDAECRQSTSGPAPAVRRAGGRRSRVLPDVQAVPPVPASPPWRATLDVRMAGEAFAGSAMLVDVRARNIGPLAWEPVSAWPRLHLSCHVRTPDERVALWDGPRFPMPRVVEPGETARFVIEFRAPLEPGDYVVEWDMVSEGEAWFADCGSETTRTTLRVVA
jgi:hypothetical protein